MPFDAVVFDLGGVLVEYRGVEPLKVLSGIQDDQELWRRSLGCRWSFVDLLDRRFLSFQLGMVKPDREIFDYVSRELGAPGRRLLLLDDNTVNVEAAIDAGWAAVKVDGVNQATRALVDHRVLPA